MADKVYTRGVHLILSGDLDWTTNTVKVLLVSASYTYAATHNFVSDVSAYELSGTNYASGFSGSGRKTLASKTATENDGSTRAELDCADLTWSSINAGTIGGLVVYLNGTSDADSALIAFLDPTDVVTNGGDVVFTIATAGLITAASA